MNQFSISAYENLNNGSVTIDQFSISAYENLNNGSVTIDFFRNCRLLTLQLKDHGVYTRRPWIGL